MQKISAQIAWYLCHGKMALARNWKMATWMRVGW
jgi:hypothetical protein